MEALYDAAEDDTATGGPDVGRKLYPAVITITGEEGAIRMSEPDAAAVAEAVVTARSERPRG